ncbi:hypothetical protein QTP88_026980 [Uroleucon formosanum]
MDRDNNTELSETKSLQHQNTFQDMAIGQAESQVVDSKISKTRLRSKYQIFNNIKTIPIKLGIKCTSLEKKEYPMTFVDELKERHRVVMLYDSPTIVPIIEKKEYPMTFVEELKERHRLSACVADKAKRRNRTIVYNMCSSASVWLMEPVFSLPTYKLYLSTVVVPSWEKREENFYVTTTDGRIFVSVEFFGAKHRAPTCESRSGARVPSDLNEITQS